MIFRRKTSEPASPATPDETDLVTDERDEDLSDDLDDPAESEDEHAEEESEQEPDEAEDPWQTLDVSKDWRDDGPFDIDEVDLDDDTVPRLDLGTLVITPAEGLQIQIVADAETGQGMAVVAGTGTSALQVTLFAAPSSQGFASDIRADMIAETTMAGGSSELTAGPFGTELRRTVPASDEAGNSGMAPLRDWFAQGPRWLLNGRLMGQAAVDPDSEDIALLDDFFRNLIVRREDGAMVPGHVIPLTIPNAPQ